MNQDLQATAKIMSQPGKGILAADESTNTIGKRFAAIDVESTEETRRQYRELLVTTPGIDQFLHGVIMFEETLMQSTADGKRFTDVLLEQGILPGIKVDKGLIDLVLSDGEKATQGLDGLPERMAAYREAGAYFAKWRAVYNITDSKPSQQAIETNAECLARYAAICQANQIVPIVEPEVLIDGDHTIERCYEVTNQVLKAVFAALERHNVALESIILKPSMVIAGNACATQASVEQVAEMTLRVLAENVPTTVPTINFLSGGQSDEQATENLQAMNAMKTEANTWELSFSYGRALQAPCLAAWQGKTDNVAAAQTALYKRLKLNSAAVLGQYNSSMEAEVVEMA
jgi:fructose-bisphosphate aldolase, class I